MKATRSIQLLAATVAVLALSELTLAEGRGGGIGVVRRLRVGNNVEDITYVASGKHRGHVAAMDGWDVMAVELDSEDDQGHAHGAEPRGAQKLFDVRGLGLGEHPPRGMEYVPSQKRFYFASGLHGEQDQLLVTDEDGRALPPLPLTYPLGVDSSTMIEQFEAVGYIPRTSANFPDHLLAITIRRPDFNSVIEIIRFDRVHGRIVGGTVVEEIAFDPDSPLYDYFIGLEYVGNPDRLIVTTATVGNEVWEVNFDGTFRGPVAAIADAADVEGLASLPDGRIALTDYARARLVFLDADFTRLPEERDFSAGLVSRPHGLAWNADTREFLTSSIHPGGAPIFEMLTAFTLHSARQFAADDPRILLPGDAAFIPATDGSPARVAVASFSRPFRGVFLYDTHGNYLSRIATQGVIQPSAFARPVALGALPGGSLAYSNIQIFPALEVIAPGGPDPTDPTSVLASEVGRIVLDAGQTSLHPAQVGSGLSFVDLNGGQILSGNSLYDLNGNLLAQIDLFRLGLNSINGGTLITSGPFSGDLAVVEGDSSTLVILRLER